jgi:probable F420-dependent oxidoreductase
MAGLAFTIFLTQDSPPPDEIARIAEANGAEALLLPDHTHIPASRTTGHPGGRQTVPDEYGDLYDPLIASAIAAAATSRLLVGTAVYLLNQRDPIVVAKQVATLDRVSGGRVLLGVGAGWLESEMRQHGVDPGRRHSMLRERVAAISSLWSDPSVAFSGDRVQLSPMRCGPSLLTRPRPRILLGGSGPRAAVRALDWADGWIPHTEVEGDHPLLDRIAATRDRAPVGFDITLAMSPADPARLSAYQNAGVNRFMFLLPSTERDAIARRIDRAATAVATITN